MAPHEQPYHTNNVKMSNEQWSPQFSQKLKSFAMLQGKSFSGRQNIVVHGSITWQQFKIYHAYNTSSAILGATISPATSSVSS
jgi:hypothetical protein